MTMPHALPLAIDWHYVPALLFVLALVVAYLLRTRSALTQRFRLQVIDELQPSKDRVWLLKNLSPRETEIARLVAEGKRNQDIAHELSIAEHTVETHLTHIYQKLGISNRVELTRAIGDLLEHL